MQYKALGKTGLAVSAVGFGGIPIQRIDAAGTRRLMEKLVEKGVNYIDTARGYTVSEEYLGTALAGLRDKFILATKSMSRTYADMKRDIEISLKNLQTDTIDIYQLHNINKEVEFTTVFGPNGAMQALLEAKAAGKIRHIGGTAHTVQGFARLLEHPEIETMMFPYNIVENQGEALMQQAAAQGVGVIAMKPLAGGNITNGRLALKYILQNENCTLAIPGMAEITEIEENCAAVQESADFTDEELVELGDIRQALSGNFCRRCGYCAPCTVGIDIPGLFVLQGYLNKYDLAGWAKQRYASSAVKADACVSCHVCESRCPYNLPIAEKMKKVAEDFGR